MSDTAEQETTSLSPEILNHPFVGDLLRTMAEIRDAVGDSNGDLENHELVQKIKDLANK